MPFQAINRCLMASVWWASDFRLSSLGLILVAAPWLVPIPSALGGSGIAMTADLDSEYTDDLPFRLV